MSDPYVGEIRLFAGNFAPLNWHLCDGTLMAIDQNNALYALIGTIYGGDGVSTFALPNLLGRVPIHQGTLSGGGTSVIGQATGTETVSLVQGQLPQHTHVLQYSTTSPQLSPNNNVPGVATAPGKTTYTYGTLASPSTVLGPVSIQNNAPAGLPHNNLQPFLAINYIIALSGPWPPRS